MSLALPLEGVTVVTLEQAVSAPFATRQLADLGARVIKVERRDGGDFARGYDRTVAGTSSAFVWANRGKRSIALDIKSDQGAEVLERLLARADVFVHNLSPDAARRAGLDTDAVAERHPRVIACAISGYGADGAQADERAYDLLIQGESGIISLTGTGDDAAKVGISIADIAAGMYAFTGILTALWHRERTGEVTPVQVAMFDSLVEWLGYPLYYTMHGGTHPTRVGTSHATIAPYGAFTTADGGQVLIAVQNQREWVRFCTEFLEDPDTLADPRFGSMADRVANRSELERIIAARFARHGDEEVIGRLRTAGIAHSRIRDLHDVADHPDLAARGRWIATGVPNGEVRTLLPPTLPSSVRDLGAVPALGEHTAELLEELGYSPEDVQAMDDREITRSEPR